MTLDPNRVVHTILCTDDRLGVIKLTVWVHLNNPYYPMCFIEALRPDGNGWQTVDPSNISHSIAPLFLRNEWTTPEDGRREI